MQENQPGSVAAAIKFLRSAAAAGVIRQQLNRFQVSLAGSDLQKDFSLLAILRHDRAFKIYAS